MDVSLSYDIESLRTRVAYNKGIWHEYEKELETEGYVMHGDWFGHTDKCFEKGMQYAVYLTDRELLRRLEAQLNQQTKEIND